MSERGLTPGTAGPVAARQPDAPNWDPPSDRPFESTPLTAPDHVPTALRHPPASSPTTDPHHRVVATDPVARRLGELSVAPPAPFDAPAGGAPALAAHCPDLFLVNVPADRRPQFVAGLTAAAVAAGQRVMVLANHPDAVFTALTAVELQPGRAVAPDEDVSGRPCVAATAHARGQRLRDATRAGLSDRVSQLQARINTEERREKLLAQAGSLSAELGRVGESAAAVVEQSDALKRLAEARDAGVAAVAAHAALRADAERELNTLKQSAVQPVGFFKKLFGAGKAEPSKLEAVEAKLRVLDVATPPDPHAPFAAGRDGLIAEETATQRAALESRLAAVRAELDALPPAEPLDELCRAFDDATTDLTRLDAGPPALPAVEMDAVRVVVGPPAAVGHDPFVTATHPEVEPRFDRIVWADAEELTEDTFTAVARLGAAWVLVGTPDPLHPPGFRNGRPRAAFFSRWWERLHTAAWAIEHDRPLARLLAVEHRDGLHCEPLHDRPDIEVRWADRDGTPTLAEVMFPAGMPLSEAKRFLAEEADEVRFGGYGSCEWETSGESIRCRWPAVDGASGVRDGVELGNGVREECVAGVTAAVVFCAKTWTRDAAARWLNERTLPPTRTAIG